MRIALISENEYGCGASIAAFRFVKGLVEAGHEVTYIFANPFKGPLNRKGIRLHRLRTSTSPSLLEKGAAQVAFPLKKILFSNRRQRIFQEIENVLATIRPEAVNLHNVALLLDHRHIFMLSRNYPVVWTMHDNAAISPINYTFKNLNGMVITTNQIDPRLILQSFQKKLARSGRVRYVTCSGWLRENNLPLLEDTNSIRHIPNGIDEAVFYPDPDEGLYKKLGLKKDRPTVLFLAAKLSYERKNLAVLLKAAKELGTKNFNFLAVGQGSYTIALKERGIFFVEPSYDTDWLRKVYSTADVYVISSLIDNLPNTVLESLFCGTPVIGSRVGGIPEMVKEGKTGYLFDPYSASSLVKKLQQFQEEGASTLLDPQALHAWAKAHYGLELMVENYLQLFRQAAKAAASSPASKMRDTISTSQNRGSFSD